MNNLIKRTINIIEKTSDLNSCMIALNLNNDSCFLCFLNIIEDAIENYDNNNSYGYLIKINKYFEQVYFKLTSREKSTHRKSIMTIRKIYKKKLINIPKPSRSILEKTYLTLELLIVPKVELSELEKKDLSELLYNIIFEFKNLEYLDRLIERNPNIVNYNYEDSKIFDIIIQKYIDCIKNKEESILYFERVIFKFILTEKFELDNNTKDKIIMDLNNFISHNKLELIHLNQIKKIIECLSFKDKVADILTIRLVMPSICLKDKENLLYLESLGSNRIRITQDIITIDDVDTHVLDDAISYIKILPNGNYLFMVHIADPLALLPYDSNAMMEAKARTQTIYLRNEVIPMLNSYYSEDKLSLIKGQERYAKTFCIEFDQDFNYVDFKILNSIITVGERHSYKSLNTLHDNIKNKFQETNFELFDKLIVALQKLFVNAELYEGIKEHNIINNLINLSGFSEQLVSYSMMLVGYLSAMYFYEHKYPFVYRCHEINQEWINLLDTYTSNSHSIEIKKILANIKGSQPNSYYSGVNKKHMALNLPYYSKLTSPLRRFADVLNHRAINTCYFSNPNDREVYLLENEIVRTCSYINLRENTIREYISKKLIKKQI